MSTLAKLVRTGCGVWIILILAGCSAPGPRNRYLQQIQPESVTNLLAYRSSTNLEIRIPLRGIDAFAHANWPRVEPGATNYQHRFAPLTFDKEKRSERRTTSNRANRLPIRGVDQWHALVLRVLSGLIPAQPGHGVLMLIENQELVAFRDASGQPSVVKLEAKPPDIILDHTYNDTDFARVALKSLESGVNSIDARERQFLFVTGEEPAFVLVDLRQRLIVFLGSPADPEGQEVPVWFAMKAINSLVVRSLIVTAIKNPVTLVSRLFWHLGTSGATVFQSGSTSPANPPPPVSTGPGMDLVAWEKDLDKIVSARRHKGRAELFIDGERFFPALIQSLQGASRTIDVLVFIFDTDDYAVKIADLLKQRSATVRVKVLLDDLGSLFAAQGTPDSPMPADFQRPSGIQSYLKSGSRVRVRASANPWITVDHRKCIIIDGKQAYLGGMNIGRQYRYDWHDLMIGLNGPIVAPLEKEYRLAWAHAGPLGDFAYAWIKLFEPASPRKNQVPNAIDLRLLRTATGKTEIYRAQLEAIERCQSYIYIENPYIDDATLLRALIRARQRGVDVRVVFPAQNDSGIMQLCNLIMANELIANGIRVFAYPGMTHVKAAVYDGWACLGSANLNKMSLRVGQELNVAYSDPATVKHLLDELFEKDFNRSREVKTPAAVDWFDAVIKAFADQS